MKNVEASENGLSAGRTEDQSSEKEGSSKLVIRKFHVASETDNLVSKVLLANRSSEEQHGHGKTKPTKNELSSVLPGYTAKLNLNSSSLDLHRPHGGLKELASRAQLTDRSTASFMKQSSENKERTKKVLSTSFLPASFKRGEKRGPLGSPGDGWFNMVPTKMTEDIKRDLAVIKNRNYLDPKRFYKSSDAHSNFLQVGTVIEGSAEFFSSRLSKKQRRSNLTEEIMADRSLADYATNKYKAMSREKAAKGARKQKRKRGKRLHA